MAEVVAALQSENTNAPVGRIVGPLKDQSIRLVGRIENPADFANIIVRDDETGFGPIIRSTRISKFDYLYGRFAGAFAAVALSFLFVPLAIVVGSLMWWVDPETKASGVEVPCTPSRLDSRTR